MHLRSALLAAVVIGSGAFIDPLSAAAQSQVAPKPGTVLHFAVTRTQGTRANQPERTIVTIRSTLGESTIAEVVARPANLRYVTRTYRGLFTHEVAEAGTIYRYEFDAAALGRLWPLASGRTATISGKLLAAPAAQFAPSAAFRVIGTYTAKFAVGERITTIMTAGPFDVFAVTRAIDRRDLQGRVFQSETGDLWYAPSLGWQVRAETRTTGPQAQVSRLELVALDEP